MGDIKLFMVLPLLMGMIGGMRTVLYGMVFIFIESIFCLVTRRKGGKDELPLGPALGLGAWLTMLLSCS